MLDQDARLDAIQNGRTYLGPEIEAIGYVFATILRPVTLEPLPWNQIDALRAVEAAWRRADARNAGGRRPTGPGAEAPGAGPAGP